MTFVLALCPFFFVWLRVST